MTEVVNRFRETSIIPEGDYLIPVVDIYETKNEIGLLIDMPGVAKDDLKIQIENKELIIYGKIRKENDVIYYTERYGLDYYRIFTLPDTIELDRIAAKMENGTVMITLPKEERARPKEIPITVIE